MTELHRETRKVGLNAAAGLCVLAFVGQALAETEDVFCLGLQTHYGQTWEPYVPSQSLVKQANVNWIRDELYWNHIEREEFKKGEMIMPGYYSRYMKRAFEMGINPMIPLDYGNVHYEHAGPPVRAFPVSREAMEAFAGYGEFVLKAFPELKMVEIWNEWHYGPRQGPDQLARLVKIVSRRLKAIRPDLIIMGPCLGTNQPDDELRLLLEEGIIDSVDGISWHPYRPNPDNYPFRFERMQAMVREFNGGKDKSMYVSETGWSTAQTPGAFTERERRRQSYINMTALLLFRGVTASAMVHLWPR